MLLMMIAAMHTINGSQSVKWVQCCCRGLCYWISRGVCATVTKEYETVAVGSQCVVRFF